MTITYESGSYRNSTFKMSLTEALRAHANHELDDAARHYKAAISGANNGYAALAGPISFFQTQAESTAQWTLAQMLRNAEQLGFGDQLDGIARVIEDPNVRATYERYLAAVRDGKRPVSERLPRSSNVDMTPTSRTKRPQ